MKKKEIYEKMQVIKFHPRIQRKLKMSMQLWIPNVTLELL